jgi:hypothetical protein
MACGAAAWLVSGGMEFGQVQVNTIGGVRET